MVPAKVVPAVEDGRVRQSSAECGRVRQSAAEDMKARKRATFQKAILGQYENFY